MNLTVLEPDVKAGGSYVDPTRVRVFIGRCTAPSRDVVVWLSDQRPRPSRNPKCDDQGIVEHAQLAGRQFAYEVCQSRLLKAHQPIALDCAFVLETFGRAHGNLRWQVAPLREHWGADNRGVIRVDQWLPAHDDEDTCRLWVTGRSADPV